MKHSKNDCKKIAASLSQYLDDELDPVMFASVQNHMRGCPPCAKFLASLQKSIELTHRKPGSPPNKLQMPEDVRVRLRRFYESFRAKNR